MDLPIKDDYLDVQSIGTERYLLELESAKLFYEKNPGILSSSGPSRKNPFYAPMVVKRELTSPPPRGEEKEVLHCEFDLRGSDISYTSGDSLGIYPHNSPSEVDLFFQALGERGTQSQIIDLPSSCYAPIPEGFFFSDPIPTQNLIHYFSFSLFR